MQHSLTFQTSKTKRITIIRHGKPKAHDEYSSFRLINGHEFEEFIRSWDHCELSSSNQVPDYLSDLIVGADLFISSELKRAIDSFRMMGIKEHKTTDLLNEATLPYGVFRNIKLPLLAWAILLRILWTCGLKSNCESRKDFKLRIMRAADYIENSMANSHHVVIMAHGFVIKSLTQALLKKNWSKIDGGNSFSYWSFISLKKN